MYKDNLRYTKNVFDTSTGTAVQRFHYSYFYEKDFIRDNILLIPALLDIDLCTASQLDQLAQLVGTFRLSGETDADLRIKIRSTALSKNSNGSIGDIIRTVLNYDNTGTYYYSENTESDHYKADGFIKLNGTQVLRQFRSASFDMAIDYLDTDSMKLAASDFIENSRAAGVNGKLLLNVKLTDTVHNVAPVGSPVNGRKCDGTILMDGTTLCSPYDKQYAVDSIRIYDPDNILLYDQIYKGRYKDGIYIYSVLLNDSELNGKTISKIEFLTSGSVNFYRILPSPIEKNSFTKILFYMENL